MKRHNTGIKRKLVLHNVPCLRCGSPTPTTGSKVICEGCKAEDKYRNKKKAEHNMERRNLNYQYLVIFNPNKEFGYPPGAIISKTEADCMSQSVCNAFDIGMILKKGEIYFVVVQDCEKQKLVQIPEPVLPMLCAADKFTIPLIDAGCANKLI